jgi:hypothetical protein
MAEDQHDAREVRVSDKFLRAAQWAADRHAAHATAVPTIPSVAQVLGLASLVLEDGGTEREAIAAMLAAHPDRGTVAPGRVPVDVLRWRARADAALERAVTEEDPAALRIRAASVLQESRALLRELRRNGTIAYVRCPAPPAEHLGHLRELVTVIARRRPRTVITQELRAAVVDIERLSELETATIAWRLTHVGAA